MKRNLNFTGRLRLPWEDIHLELRPESDALRISGSIDLSELATLDPKKRSAAVLVIEVYDSGKQSSRVRLDAAPDLTHGRVEVSGSADAIAHPQSLLCRVRIVEAPAPGASVGRILAAADRIRPVSEGPRQGLLPFKSGELNGPVWTLVTDPAPEIQIEQSLEDWQGVGRTPYFQSLVMPTIARDIASWLLDELASAHDIEEQPVQQWLSFYGTLGFDLDAWHLENQDADAETRADLLNEIQSTFSRRHRIVSRYPTAEVNE